MKFSALLLSLVTVLFAPDESRATPGDATELTQLMNHAEMAKIVAQQAQEISQQLRMIQDLTNNSKTLPTQYWTTVSTDLQTLMRIVEQGQSIAFSAKNSAKTFQQRFPGFKPMDTQSGSYSDQYKQWSDTVHDTLQSALAAANLQSAQFGSEAAVMDQIKIMSQTSAGRMQALQIGNQIAFEQTAQLQKLRALMMSQMQAQTVWMAGQQQHRDTSKAALDAFFAVPEKPKNQAYKGFKGGSEK